MDNSQRLSPLYQATLRLMSRVAGARESLQHLTHMAAAEGRIDLALSLRSVDDHLDDGETETIAVLRRLDSTGRRLGEPPQTPRRPPTPRRRVTGRPRGAPSKRPPKGP